MPKLKTNKAMKKRFRRTRNGKVLSRASLRRHILTDRSSKKKRQTRGWHSLEPMDVKRIEKGLPYDR